MILIYEYIWFLCPTIWNFFVDGWNEDKWNRKLLAANLIIPDNTEKKLY